ncbi:hypothetical protein [Sneathiella limimaris]|uniref:hypothetical protein n=1 Tax=Sneathiella limimaris TaxID=1964213 RepID=UPI00146A59DA|nr:hypothetical protein [Sneathiella limimaris]
MRKLLIGCFTGAGLMFAAVGGSLADEKGADDLALEGISKLMEALEMFVDAIPQYSAPEMLENGDIIIRRKNKLEPDDEKDEPELEKTKT